MHVQCAAGLTSCADLTKRMIRRTWWSQSILLVGVIAFSLASTHAQSAEGKPEQSPLVIRNWKHYDPKVGYLPMAAVTIDLPKDRAALDSLDKLRGYKRLHVALIGPEVDNGTLAKVARLENLTDLYLLDTSITSAGLNHLAAHPRLEGLSAGGGPEIDADGMKHLAQVGRLRTLRVMSPRFNNAAAEILASVSELHELVLHQTSLTDSGLAQLAKLANLQLLDLRENPQLGDDGLSNLKSLPRLQYLQVDKQNQFSRTGVAYLKSLPALRRVEGISDELVYAHLPNVARRRRAARFNEETRYEFMGNPVRDVFEYLGELHDMEFRVDNSIPALAITSHVLDEDLRSRLDLFESTHDFVWTVQPDHIQILSTEKALKDLVLQTYDAGAVVGDDESAVAKLVQLLSRVVAPDSWAASHGGMAKTVARKGTRITVAHAPHVHRKIEALIDQIGQRGGRDFLDQHDRKVLNDLDKKIRPVDSKEPRLEAAIGFIGDQLAMSIEIHHAAMRKQAMALKERVAFPSEKLPARAALDQVLKQVKWAWTVQNGALLVYPRTVEDSVLQTRVYHVGDLLGKTRSAKQLAQQIQATANLAGKQGRLSDAVANRIVVRAHFREHEVIADLLARMRAD